MDYSYSHLSSLSIAPLSSFRTFSQLQKETLYPLTVTHRFPLTTTLPSPQKPLIYSQSL